MLWTLIVFGGLTFLGLTVEFQVIGAQIDAFIDGEAALPPMALIFPAYFLLAAYMVVDYGVLDGTPGLNPYGPSPKGIGPESPLEVFD